MSNPPPNTLVSCPYNKAHQIEHFKMHLHLQKCRKQHPNNKKAICPFDVTHVINDVELDYHIRDCPKRTMLDAQLYILDDDHRPVVKVETATADCEEIWDDGAATSYIPDLTRNNIITRIRGATPSERRKARMEAIAKYKPKQ